MEKKILKELLKRPGMSEQDWELLEDMIHDSIIDMRSYLNYEDEDLAKQLFFRIHMMRMKSHCRKG